MNAAIVMAGALDLTGLLLLVLSPLLACTLSLGKPDETPPSAWRAVAMFAVVLGASQAAWYAGGLCFRAVGAGLP